ncbi:MAG: SulP family inorganic anion transporter [Rhodomicrobium sp.]
MQPLRSIELGEALAGETVRAGSTATRGSAAGRFKSVFFDLPAGLAGGLTVFAYCASYAALIFQGDLADGVPLLVWGFMISAAFAGLIAGSLTKLQPLGFGPDSAAAGLLVSLVASVGGSVKANGGSIAESVATTVLALWLTGILSYAAMWLLGYWRAARFFRFVPYSVVAGFLGSTGILLVMAGISLSLGGPFHGKFPAAALTLAGLEKLAASAALAALLLVFRIRLQRRLLLSLGALLACAFALLLAHLASSSTPGPALFLQNRQDIRPWLPFEFAMSAGVHWKILAFHLPQMLAAVFVVQISNVVKTSSIEITRSKACDLDAEFQYNGAATLAAAVFGGIGASISTGVSSALTSAGGRTRLSGVFAALFVGSLLLLKVDILNVVPVPFLAGLAIFLGLVLFIESFRLPLLQRAWLDLVPAVGIMLICLRFGHMTGVAAGILLACLMFAYSYAKLGPVKRHVTAASLSSNVVRAKEHTGILRREGDAIHIYWISGYLFFGTSDRLFEDIRRGIEAQRGPQIEYIVLDMAEVTGMDSSAGISLVKLKNLCAGQGIRLIFCGLSYTVEANLKTIGLLPAGGERMAFADRNEALAWCETGLLAAKGAKPDPAAGKLENWLIEELGENATKAILPYFERKPLKENETLYNQGDSAGTIDLVAEGSIAIVLRRGQADGFRLRLMKTQTVVGEMGFFRNSLRTASVVGAGEGVVYSLTREAFDRLEKDSPSAAISFLEFIVRTLADRVDFANRETAALL